MPHTLGNDWVFIEGATRGTSVLTEADPIRNRRDTKDKQNRCEQEEP
jgi:hypothetical protein